MKNLKMTNVGIACAAILFAFSGAYATEKTDTPFDRFLAWSMQAKQAKHRMWDRAVLGTIREDRPEARTVRVETTEYGDFDFSSAKSSGQILGIEQNAYVSLQYSFFDDKEARTVVVYGKATLQNSFKKTTSSGEVVDYVTYRVKPTHYKFDYLNLRGDNRVHIHKYSLDDGKWYSHTDCHYPSKDCEVTSKTPYVD